jgi:putative PEP-CTERM system histidine kinase
MIAVYAGAAALLLAGLPALFFRRSEAAFSLTLLRVLAALPCLAAVYFYAAEHPAQNVLESLATAEIVFALLWLAFGGWIEILSRGKGALPPDRRRIAAEIIAGGVVLASGAAGTAGGLVHLGEDGVPLFPENLVFFLASLLILIAALLAGLCLEIFWRRLSAKQRWEHKTLVIGAFLISALFTWIVSHRLTYHRMTPDHLRLSASLLLLAWVLMGYAVLRHRLLNRRLFVSRKVVYASVAPLAFGIYLMALGLIAFFIRRFGLPFSFVFQWFLVAGGIVFLVLMALSGKVRHAIKFFVSTHFYNNKYEYRDEWLAFSRRLQDARSEMEVIDAFHRILSRSLFTNVIAIWTGTEERGFRMVLHRGVPVNEPRRMELNERHPLVVHLRERRYFHIPRTRNDPAGESGPSPPPPLAGLDLILFAPLSAGDRLVGLVGVGPEFTGGRYGHDDFDLLEALGSQAASAIMAARSAEALAEARRREAWDVMAAFILHDVKNAASMLSLIRQNAPNHLDDPEFRVDMLESIDHALRRMDKVRNRLDALKQEVEPEWSRVELGPWLSEECRRLERRLRELIIRTNGPEGLEVRTDPEILIRILENLMLNAMQAGASRVQVDVKNSDGGGVEISVRDDGPGIPETLLPDGLFEPFRTTKAQGTGVGLWQAKRLAVALGGDLKAGNAPDGGAVFHLSFTS